METTNLENVVEGKQVTPSNTVDMTLDLSAIRKKRIAIDGDDKRVIELNTSDMSIVNRLEKLATRMSELSEKVSNLKYDDDLQEIPETSEISESIKTLDIEMRTIIDDLFQSKVSDTCVPNGTMFDMYNGSFTYEILIDKLLNLYADNITAETEKVRSRISKHTAKYMPQDHKKKG